MANEKIQFYEVLKGFDLEGKERKKPLRCEIGEEVSTKDLSEKETKNLLEMDAIKAKE